MWTSRFDRMVAPARGAPALWRTALGLGLAAAAWFAALVGAMALVAALAGPADADAWVARILRAETPTGVLVLLATFAGMLGGVALAARLLHGRGLASLVGAGAGPPFAAAALICLGVAGTATLVLPRDFALVANTPPGLFASFLPAALAGLALQTGAEEVVFRGYLQTQLAARFRSPLVWMLVPSLLFGLAHLDPAGAGRTAIWIVAATTLFGLIAADLTRVTGNIGAAWGLHLANNALAVLVVSVDGPLSGLALWTTPFGLDRTEVLRPLVAQDMLVSVIVWACIRLWLARRDDGDAAARRDLAIDG